MIEHLTIINEEMKTILADGVVMEAVVKRTIKKIFLLYLLYFLNEEEKGLDFDTIDTKVTNPTDS